MADWPESDTRSGQFFDDAQFRIEKDPDDPIGYWTWRRSPGGIWNVDSYFLTWWGAKRRIRQMKASPPLPKPIKAPTFWYF